MLQHGHTLQFVAAKKIKNNTKALHLLTIDSEIDSQATPLVNYYSFITFKNS